MQWMFPAAADEWQIDKLAAVIEDGSVGVTEAQAIEDS